MPQPSALLAPVVAAGLLGCAAERQSWRDLAPPEALVEVLPRAALVELDGRLLGAGSRTVPVPEPTRLYKIRATAPGFEPAEVEQPGEKLAGSRLGMALRPEGFGFGRRIDLDDPSSLTLAAAQLEREGRAPEAVEYAERALSMAELPLAHRVLGAAYARLGDRRASIRHYADYLGLAPDAPDAAAISRALEKARGDITIPPGDETRAPPSR
jgi:tetratricopeptide (TPR) repeat protein